MHHILIVLFSIRHEAGKPGFEVLDNWKFHSMHILKEEFLALNVLWQMTHAISEFKVLKALFFFDSSLTRNWLSNGGTYK